MSKKKTIATLGIASNVATLGITSNAEGSKKQMVTLLDQVSNTTQDFEINHAERILRMRNNGGWILPEDSNYQFDFNNGIGYRKNQEGNRAAEETAGNQQGDNSPEQN